MTQLWRTLRGHRTTFTVIVILEAAAGGLAALVHPLLLKALFDQAIVAGQFHRFLGLGAFYLAFGLFLNAGGYGIACWRKRFENAFMLSLEMELLDRAIAQDGRTLSKAGNASYVSRVHNDVYEGVLPAVDVTIRIARQAVSSVVFIGVLLYLSWEASLVLLVIVPPLVFMSNRIARRIQDNTEPEREAEAQYISKLSRTLEAFHAVRGMPLLQPGARTANREALRRFLGITFVNFRLAQRQRSLSDLIMNGSDTASMITGAYFVFAGRMTFGSFLAFVNSLWQAVTGIFAVINMVPQVRHNAAVLQRIEGLRRSGTVLYHEEAPVVLVHDARVRYGDEDDSEVSIDHFELHSGEHVLVRGPNGCGKTTLLHIIAGTLAPDTGLVTLPPRVASLTAPVNLPPLPVRDLVTDEGLRTVMDLDGLAGQLPADLSSGQRQRVGVAALLCEDADAYLVDEPFANLDHDGRELVLRVLTDRTRGRGLLMVHHGDSDLDKHFDRVVTMSTAAAARAR